MNVVKQLSFTERLIFRVANWYKRINRTQLEAVFWFSEMNKNWFSPQREKPGGIAFSLRVRM